MYSYFRVLCAGMRGYCGGRLLGVRDVGSIIMGL